MIAGLPYDAEVQYLETVSWGAWIDTGILANASTSFDIVFTGLAGGNFALFGTSNSGNTNGAIEAFWYSNFFQFVAPTSNTASRVISTESGTYGIGLQTEITYSNSQITIKRSDGLDKSYAVSPAWYGEYESTRTVVFPGTHRRNDTASYMAAIKCYAMKILNRGELVRDYIPVRFTNELGVSEGAMYDRVSRKLFRNAGTGSFTIGPDVATPVMGLHFMPRPKYTARDYVHTGLIAMWDGIENAGWGVHDPNATTWKDLSGNGIDMISNGSPVFFDKYISPTQLSEMFHTDTTDAMDDVLENGICTFEVVGDCVVGKNIPKMVMFGDSNGKVEPSFACGDPTRVGFSCRFVGTSVSNYSHNPTFATVVLRADGTNLEGIYQSLVSDVRLNRTTPLSFPYSVPDKRFVIGYRIGYYPDSPMVNGEKVYCARVYNRPLSDAEIAVNHAIDKERFNSP